MLGLRSSVMQLLKMKIYRTDNHLRKYLRLIPLWKRQINMCYGCPRRPHSAQPSYIPFRTSWHGHHELQHWRSDYPNERSIIEKSMCTVIENHKQILHIATAALESVYTWVIYKIERSHISDSIHSTAGQCIHSHKLSRWSAFLSVDFCNFTHRFLSNGSFIWIIRPPVP